MTMLRMMTTSTLMTMMELITMTRSTTWVWYDDEGDISPDHYYHQVVRDLAGVTSHWFHLKVSHIIILYFL